MLHRPHNRGRGTPTCEGAKGQGRSHSKHGLARSPEPSVPCGRGRAWGRREAWSMGRPQGDCAIRVCPWRAQTPAQPHFLWHLHGRGQHQLLWALDPPQASSRYTQIGCYLFCSSKTVHMPGSTHTQYMHTHSVPSKYLQNEQPHRCKGTHCAKMDTDSPSHPHTVHVVT